MFSTETVATLINSRCDSNKISKENQKQIFLRGCKVKNKSTVTICNMGRFTELNKKFFIMRVVQLWKRLPREMEESHPGDIQNSTKQSCSDFKVSHASCKR